VDGPEDDFLGGAVARAAVAREAADVSAGDIGGTVNGERHAVWDLSLPSFGVKTRLIPSAFAGIDVNPSSLVFGVHFGPNVVFGVPDPADSGADRATEHAETIGPFTNPASSGLQQLPHIWVSRESFVGGTAIIGATVQFNSGGTTSGFVGAGRCHALGDGGHIAPGARRIVDKLEEGSLEPPEQCTDDTILVAPFRLPWYAGSGSLHDLGLFFGLRIQAIEWDHREGLVQKTRVFVLRRRNRQPLK
jgi:hypothetical protein